MHLINQAHSILLVALALATPFKPFFPSLIILHPANPEPSSQSILPEPSRYLEMTDPTSGRVDGIIWHSAKLLILLPTVCSVFHAEVTVAYADIGIDPNAKVLGKPIVGVDETAFGAFDVPLCQGIWNAAEPKRVHFVVEWACIHGDNT